MRSGPAGQMTTEAGAERTILAQARAENFPVAPRFLPARYRKRLMDIYGYARLVDDIGDEAQGDRSALLDAIEADVDRIYEGAPVFPLISSLQATVRECSIPPAPLKGLIEANRVDQRVARYATFDDLLDYCRLSAEPVGRLVLYAFGESDEAKAQLSDHICSALQVIEHIQDVGEDFERGRIYMPQADFSHTGATESDLGASSTSHGLRHLLALETTRAEQMLRSGGSLVGRLSGWGRVAVAGFVGGGLAQVRALRKAEYEVLAGDVKASKPAVAGRALIVAIRGRA